MTDANGKQYGNTVKYLPFGEARAAIDIPTDKLFTGQRLDSTGLYYYNARYYDPEIGRFISPDPLTHTCPLPDGQIIKGLTVCRTLSAFAEQTRNPLFVNPQQHNRYSYALNNPLKYTDPDGHIAGVDDAVVVGVTVLLFIGAMFYYYAYVAPDMRQQGASTSINNAITYAWDSTKQAVQKVVTAIAGFFNNLNPFDNKPDNKPDNNSQENKIKINEDKTNHIFRDADGHFKYDTPANRAALEDVANDKAAFQGEDAFGNLMYAKIDPWGNQIWVEVRNGLITNGGINYAPYLPIFFP